MSISSYAYLSIIRAVDKPDDTAVMDYQEVLDAVRSSIAQKHADELVAALDDASAADVLRSLILKYTAEVLAGQEFDREGLPERIYQDMAGLGILTQYLQDPTVEEININNYAMIEITKPGSTHYVSGKDAFPSPSAALDVVKRMVRMGGLVLDAQTPAVDSYIGAGIRISAMIPPIVPIETGVAVSIRKQVNSSLSKEMLIKAGAATEEMLEFLTLCICNGVSVGIAGGTGSGKSTLENFLLNEYIHSNDDINNRVYTIEDSRELMLTKYDELHDRPARVITTLTMGGAHPITMFDLIVSALRYHPALIVPAEVRDGAAYQAAIAGGSGHTIVTSFHANNARDAYDRLTTLCHTAGTGLSNDLLLDMCIKAWPIVVQLKQLKDGSRRLMEIFEATGQENGHAVGNLLYTFEVQETFRNPQGQVVRVVGKHKRCGYISPKTYSTLRDNGVAAETLQRLFPETVPEDVT